MKLAEYKIIVTAAEKYKNLDCQKLLLQEFPHVPKLTLGSIHSTEIQRRVKKAYYKVVNPNSVAKLYQRYCKCVDSGEAPGVIIRIAQDIDFAPAMVAKILLENYLSLNATPETRPVSKSQVNKLLRDTSLIPDRDLAYEVYLCLLDDCAYGPFSDSIKHSVGHEYEFLLRRKLESLNIDYHDEDDLRLKGYDKTPDIKLDIPIAIDGHVINWIESKALFGDEEYHRTYLRDQFWSYWNRFGPGLVIYWFGFIEELDEHREKGIILRDSFPNDITLMEPLFIRS